MTRAVCLRMFVFVCMSKNGTFIIEHAPARHERPGACVRVGIQYVAGMLDYFESLLICVRVSV